MNMASPETTLEPIHDRAIADALEVKLPTLTEMAAARVDRETALLRATEITDAETAQSVTERAQAIARLKASSEDERKSFTKPLDALKADWMAKYKPITDSCEAHLVLARTKIGAWNAEQRRIADEAAAKARAIAQENERKRIAEVNEARRLADEKADIARAEVAAYAEDAERTQAAAMREAMKAGRTDEAAVASRKLDEAQRAAAEDIERVETERANAQDAADDLARTPVMTPAVSTHVAPPKPKGATSSQVPEYELVSLEMLLRGILADVDKGDRSTLRYVTIDKTEIGKQVRASGVHTRIPGITVRMVDRVAIRK